jgi:hypothetical protein
MKMELIEALEFLQASAQQRGTKQGLKIYELAIDQLNSAASAPEVSEIHSRLKGALMGIETHGSYTSAEYEVVRKILDA